MSDRKALINREIDARREMIRGRIVSQPTFKNFDGIGAQFLTPVVDVDVGAERPLRDVPVKINGPKARFYAKIGSPVFLAKDAQGRYQVVGPADRAKEQGSVRLVSISAGTSTAAGNIGLQFIRQPFEFYQADSVPGNSLWNDGVNGFPKFTILDGSGNEV